MTDPCAASSSRRGEIASGDRRTPACGKVRTRRLPALRPRLRRGTPQANTGVDCDAAAGEREHGVQVELGDLGDVLRQAREPVDEIDERADVRRRSAAEAADETAGLAAEDELLRV